MIARNRYTIMIMKAGLMIPISSIPIKMTYRIGNSKKDLIFNLFIGDAIKTPNDKVSYCHDKGPVIIVPYVVVHPKAAMFHL